MELILSAAIMMLAIALAVALHMINRLYKIINVLSTDLDATKRLLNNLHNQLGKLGSRKKAEPTCLMFKNAEKHQKKE